MKTWMSLAFFLTLTACGIENPYKDPKSGCKVNCGSNEDQNPKPRSAQEINFSPDFWMQKLDALTKPEAKEIFEWLKFNPFELMETMLLNVTSGIKPETTVAKNEYEKCYLDALKTTASKEGSLAKLQTAYGNCQPLQTMKMNSGAKVTDTDIILGHRLEVKETHPTQTTPLIDKLTNSHSLAKVFPFSPLAESVAKTETTDLEFLMTRVLGWNFDFEKDSEKVSFETFFMYSMGIDEKDRFKVSYNPASRSVKLNGAVDIAAKGPLNWLKEDQLPFLSPLGLGEGVQTYIGFTFEDFEIEHSNEVGLANPFLFSNKAVLRGTYFVSFGTFFSFRVVAQDKPCVLTLYPASKDPNEAAIGDIDICAAK